MSLQLRLNKRGFERLWIWTYYLVLFSVLVLVLMFNAQSIVSNKYFQQSYESKDIALLIDTMYISPGHITADYGAQEGFRYIIGKGKVTVSEKVPAAYAYAGDNNQKIALSNDGEIIRIEKK